MFKVIFAYLLKSETQYLPLNTYLNIKLAEFETRLKVINTIKRIRNVNKIIVPRLRNRKEIAN